MAAERLRPALRLLSVACAASAHAPAAVRAEAGSTPLFHKGVYDSAAKCARLGWFIRRRQFVKPRSAGADFFAEQGRAFELHVLASADLAPNVVELPAGLSAVEAAAQTRAAMADAVRELCATGDTSAILQPTFVAGPLVARADAIVLAPLDSEAAVSAARAAAVAGDDIALLSAVRWDLLEIKSVLASNACGKAADLAFTLHAAQAAGTRVRDALLYAVNPLYRLGTADTVPLHAAVNLTEQVRQLVSAVLAPDAAAPCDDAPAGGRGATACDANAESDADEPSGAPFVDRSVARLERLTALPEPAGATPFLGCKGCVAESECAGRGVSHPLWELPRIGDKALNALVAASSSLEIAHAHPDDVAGLTLPQARFYRAVLRGDTAPILADAPDDLRRALRAIELPVRYLDFEAAGLLFPPLDGLAPFEPLLTQYSVHTLSAAHVERAPGGLAAALDAACGALARSARGEHEEVDHREYLADATRDWREELLCNLLRDLGEPETAPDVGARARGSIVVYSSYEGTQLQRLAAEFPQLAERTLRVRARLVDLEVVVRKCVSHALFRGRSSLKVALPTLAPHLSDSYARDAIGDGSAAAAAFARLAAGELSDAETAALRAQLLDYCALDTRAMVELHRALLALAEPVEDSSALAGAPRGAPAARVGPAEALGGVADVPPDASAAPIERMLVCDLKAELGLLGERRTGTKAELAARLTVARQRAAVARAL